MSGFLLNPYAYAGDLFQFTNFTFISNTYGPTGPTSVASIGYDTTTYPWLNNSLYYSISSGIQIFTVPSTGQYDIEVAGASSIIQYYSGSTSPYGRGSRFKIRTTLTAGTKLKVLVGQVPYTPQGFGTTANPYTGQTPSSSCFNGGGGGTFVTLLDNTPIVVAGGGASVRAGYSFVGTYDAVSSLSGGPSWTANVGYNGSGIPVAAGTNGGGGACLLYDQGSSGAGLLGDGTDANLNTSYYTGAKAFVNGGSGALATNVSATPHGGFGGGGAGGWGGAGGGGGYSGGGSGSNNSTASNGGGGSNFIMTGASIITGHSYNTGSGFVTITKV